MAAAVFLTLSFLFFEAHSQIYGPGPIYPGTFGIDPGPCGPCGTDLYGTYGPYCDPYVPVTIPAALPNILPITPPVPCAQTILNNLQPPSFIQNQIPCGNLVNQPLLTNPIAPCAPLFTNVPQLTPSVISSPAPQCTAASPVIATTIVDNTLANSLANAIQLLIVSNLIENTLGSSSGCGGNILAQALGLLDTPCVNNFELVSPDFYPSGQVIACNCPDVPFYQDIGICQSPCDLPVLCGSPFDNCGPNPFFGVDTCSNPFGSPVIPSFGCIEPAIAPVAVEVPFPASIPAQMICNFGYLPTNVPCVSVNVEPLPYESFNSLFGNFGNYIC